MPKWLQSFEVPSTSGRGTYIVSLDTIGNWGCSCPQWKFRRVACKHVLSVQAQVAETRPHLERVIPTCRAANVLELTKERDDLLLIPLLPLNDDHFLATVVVDLLMHGIPFFEIRQRYHLPSQRRREDYIQLVLTRGRRIYAPSASPINPRPCLVTQAWNLPDLPLPGETVAAYSERTGCLKELAQIALDQLQSQPLVARPTPILQPRPAPRTGKRRILSSA
jgi:hypothetical protein